MAVDIHSEYRPTVTHDMHQMGSDGARMFVPPFREPADPNIHPLLIAEQAQIGMAMSSALVAAGKTGIVQNDRYDLWTPARQYMLYHGQPRILTEIASARLADPAGQPRRCRPFAGAPGFQNRLSGSLRLWGLAPLGHCRVRRDRGVRRSRATGPASDRLARELSTGFTKIGSSAMRPHMRFVIPADQPDPFETYELLNILDVAEVEIHQARSAFTAGGTSYSTGSWVI